MSSAINFNVICT